MHSAKGCFSYRALYIQMHDLHYKYVYVHRHFYNDGLFTAEEKGADLGRLNNSLPVAGIKAEGESEKER
jgi:hypothetical protein